MHQLENDYKMWDKNELTVALIVEASSISASLSSLSSLESNGEYFRREEQLEARGPRRTKRLEVSAHWHECLISSLRSRSLLVLFAVVAHSTASYQMFRCLCCRCERVLVDHRRVHWLAWNLMIYIP